MHRSQMCNSIEYKHKITPKIINSHGFGEENKKKSKNPAIV